MSYQDKDRAIVTIQAYEARYLKDGRMVWDWHLSGEQGALKYTMFFGDEEDAEGDTESDKASRLLIAIGAKPDQMAPPADWRANLATNVIGKKVMAVVAVDGYGAKAKYMNAFVEALESPFGSARSSPPKPRNTGFI